MSFYAYSNPRGGNTWWMSKERGGPRHRHHRHEEFERGDVDPRQFRGGPFGPGFGGPGFGGPGFGGPGGPFGGGRGRKRRGDVRIALLMLLDEEPRNGYQLMQIIEERSGGRWRPSPGSVYPALSQLEDEGYVRTINQDSGRAFEITDTGRQQLADREDDTPPWEVGDSPRGQAFHDLRTKLFALGKASIQVVQVGNEEQWAKASEVLDEARRNLYRILADEPGEATEPAEANESGETTEL